MDLVRKLVTPLLLPVVHHLYGLPVLKYVTLLKKSTLWDQKQRQSWRLQKLQTMLQYCWDTVPFYRAFWSDHGVTTPHIESIDQLGSFPLLTKDIFRAHAKRLQPRDVSSIRHQKKHSGGTTGHPIHYLQDMEQWAFMQAFHQWAWAQTGYRPGDPIAILAGGSLLPQRMSRSARLRNFLEHKLFLFGMQIDRELAWRYHEILTKQNIQYLYGYPSFLFLFTRYLKEKNLRLPNVKAIITNGEMLYPHCRAEIEAFFGFKVFNNLGSNDGGYEAYECQHHNGFHYNDLQCVLETINIDNKGMGSLVITNLWNHSTPFIRYENGDWIKLGNKPCPCGLVYPLIEDVIGRTTDILSFSNGKSLTGPALSLIFSKMDIDEWQVVQKNAMQIEVRIRSPQQTSEQQRGFIRSVFAHHVTDQVIVDIKNVEHLEASPMGKLKQIVKECSLEQMKTHSTAQTSNQSLTKHAG
ncbi:MAG: phenylacetate--CoA ligase family protein [Chitinivibrionales bacterium]|nr:phenylacetate--CoA ligase family protein [Chitinivibrionales bacterium]